jgi:hypothetical protein
MAGQCWPVQPNQGNQPTPSLDQPLFGDDDNNGQAKRYGRHVAVTQQPVQAFPFGAQQAKPEGRWGRCVLLRRNWLNRDDGSRLLPRYFQLAVRWRPALRDWRWVGLLCDAALGETQ